MSTQVDQAIASLKKAEDFITCGLVAIPDFASEFAAVDTPDQTKVLNEYRDLMKKYVAMENDYRSYMSSVGEIKTMVSIDHIESNLYCDCSVCCSQPYRPYLNHKGGILSRLRSLHVIHI